MLAPSNLSIQPQQMPVPDFQSLMLPVLRALAGGDVRLSEVRALVAETEGLTPDDLRELVPSGRQPKFDNRVSWSLTHMERAGLVQRVRRGVYGLTQEGESLLSRSPDRVDIPLLRGYPAYGDWRGGRNRPPSPNRGDRPERTGGYP